MADKKIDEVTHDDAIGGSEKLPMDDAGTAKYATTGDVKNYVLAQIAALAAAQGVNLTTDGVYLLKDGALKPIGADTLAEAVLDYGLALTGVASVNNDVTIGVKDGANGKKTMTVSQLASFLASNVAIPWASLAEVTQQADLASNDLLVFRDVSAGTGGADKKFTFTTFSSYVHAAFKAYVASLTGIQSGDAVAGTDVVYLIHGNDARQATVAQLLAAAGITNAVSGPNATTENKVPQWDSSTRTLKDGKPVVSVLDASDGIPTAAAVKTYVDNHAVDGVVKTTDDQTIGGTKTFSLPPVVPTPTLNTHSANKKYVDDKLVGSFVTTSGDQNVGGVKTFNLSPSVPIPTGSNDASSKAYVDDNFTSLSGTQTISGSKTFSTVPVVSGTIPSDDNTTKVTTTSWVVSKIAEWWTSICAAAQTISGVWTFSSSPVVPTPTTDMQASTKKYVDDNAVKVSGNQTIEGVKTFSSFPVLPTETPTEPGQSASKKYVDDTLVESANCVLLDGDQTIADTKTFTSFPVMPSRSPTNDYEAATKKYVDDNVSISECVLLSGNQTISGVKTFENPPVSVVPTVNDQLANKQYVDDSFSECVLLRGNQTISGVKTFENPPVSVVPTVNGQLANKQYVDDSLLGSVKLTGDQSIGGVKTFTSLPILPSTTPTQNYHAASKKYVDDTFVSLGNCVLLDTNQTIADTKTFTSSPMVPTISYSDNSQRSASTAFVRSAINAYANRVHEPRFPIVSKTVSNNSVTLTDAAINIMSISIGNTFTAIMPSAMDNPAHQSDPTIAEKFSRSFILVLTVGGLGSGTVTLNLDSSCQYYAEQNDTFSITPGFTHVIGFTEKSENVFQVSRRTFTHQGTAFTGIVQ